ncbi:hypothetical protein PCC8801_1155 [Rippkaea orientalis PCC 8801]|uniref:Uncharacterized protein n=1 Tax=Rippkaea orientalis (strain PCC 8801 / RF-1) TaxID=41431 RepID=B7K289_RIPO1|nr:hypothetical protein [Rippkaea orientalis]ACK65225.1 hypothetical protein PCC8801_1155 [Rippkaea orientalis PCC 8801]
MNTNNDFQSNKWELGLGIVCILALLIVELLLIGWLIRDYKTHQPDFQLLRYGAFRPEFELLGFTSFILLLVSGITQWIAFAISKLPGTHKKTLLIIVLWVSIILMFLSLGLLFISHTPGRQWLGYLLLVAYSSGNATLIFSQVVVREQKRFSNTLLRIGFVLIIGASLSDFFAK